MSDYLPSLSNQRLLGAADAADDLARNGSEGGRVIAEVVGRAVVNEINDRLGKS